MQRLKKRLSIFFLGLAVLPSPALTEAVSRSAWFEMISSGQVEQVRVLISSGKVGVLSTVDDQNNTPLHLAAERCNTGMVKMLLSQRADPLLRNKWNDTPLIIAAVRCGKTAPVTQLIAQAASGRSASQAGATTPGGGRTGSPSNSSSSSKAAGAPSSGSSAAGPNLVGVQPLAVPAAGSRNACFSVSWQTVTLASLPQADRLQNYRAFLDGRQQIEMLVGTNRCSGRIYVIAAACNDVLTRTNERLGFDVLHNRDFLKPGESMILGYRFSKINRLSAYDTGVAEEYHNFVVSAYSAVDANWLSAHGSALMNRHDKTFERRLNVVLQGQEAEYTIPNFSGAYSANPQAAHLYGLDQRSCLQTQFRENWDRDS